MKFILWLVIFFSCSSYQPINITQKFVLTIKGKKGESVKVFHFNQTRYFKIINSSSPIAKINNTAIESGLKRNYHEAKILFEQAFSLDKKNAAINNNLGLICEFLNEKENALDFYNQACMINPDNKYYRSNFLNCKD